MVYPDGEKPPPPSATSHLTVTLEENISMKIGSIFNQSIGTHSAHK
jgi:hypothetical protein